MNSSQYFIIFLIIILVIAVIHYYCSCQEITKDDFGIFSSMDSVYAPIGTYDLNNSEKAIPLTKYANQVAYDLQNPFPSSVTNNSNVPWNPASYREVQEPDGQFVGIISPN